jgi:thiol-disulfide isomerase/thioredoxin
MKQLFYFTAPWCAPCQSFGPTMDRINTSILSENKGDWAPVEKVNIDYEADRAKAAKVMNIPTVILTKPITSLFNCIHRLNSSRRLFQFECTRATISMITSVIRSRGFLLLKF